MMLPLKSLLQVKATEELSHLIAHFPNEKTCRFRKEGASEPTITRLPRNGCQAGDLSLGPTVNGARSKPC